MKYQILLIVTILFIGCSPLKVNRIDIGTGWSRNSVNTVIFRQNALTTYGNNQVTAYYDSDSNLILARRKLGSRNWTVYKTGYKGDTSDAHRDISIAVDGEGYLHVSWDHHNSHLRYAKSKAPLQLELGPELLMTGKLEEKVTYPEFYNLPDGNLLFCYRSGQSGKGSMVMNFYDHETKEWSQLHSNLLDGEEERSAYWQGTVDENGAVHLSWTWRESWDVATNHDICYAVSYDNGKTWEKSTGEKYQLPITEKTAEYAWRVPQHSNLINQTSMTTNNEGLPFIATYWEEDGSTQYQVIYRHNDKWKHINTGFRKTNFDLGGGGTKSIPISRPEILVNGKGKLEKILLLFRDEERGNKISLASKILNSNKSWEITDISMEEVGQWEPNYDRLLWKEKEKLNVFMQKVRQVDAEGLAKLPATPVSILELKNIP
ncbi:neuraminidase [Christiangramia fulva]|uniref:Neuraminidase n=1 Tax=Christiangramia fulva TaxID=2126553 RepID=A0A2R3ZB25_9FLAO|nr:BNR repeat-containing protein [Christiangramia fulva]AVR47414.1 neuraminidase [Christiangramia fulva]